MKQVLALLVCAICITMYQSNGLNLIEVPREYIRQLDVRSRMYGKYNIKPFKPLRTTQEIQARRQGSDEAKDKTIKEKIGILIEQTIIGANKELDSIQETKKQHNTTAGYKIGFLMYMVKRSRDVMNELFTVAVNHREDWKALDQLKIFELIIHTNVDTSNLLRQLLEIATQDKEPPPPPDSPPPPPDSPPASRLRYALL